MVPRRIIVLVIVLVLFGGSQIPKLARNLGRAQKEFKDGMDDGAKAAGSPTVVVADERHRHHRHVEQRHQQPPATPERGSTAVGSRARRSSVGRHHAQAAALEDAAALALAAATPHPVVDALFEGVVEAPRRAPGSRHRSCAPCRRRRRRSGRTSTGDRAGSSLACIQAVTLSSKTVAPGAARRRFGRARAVWVAPVWTRPPYLDARRAAVGSRVSGGYLRAIRLRTPPSTDERLADRNRNTATT